MATSSYDESFMEDSIHKDESGKEEYGVRDVTLFLVDASPPMFDKTNEQGDPYFLEALKRYIEILGKKLLWNRWDWMGLILFATEQWDTDPEVKNILTLQQLSCIKIDHMIKAREEVINWEKYKSISSSTSYPLRELFWHVTLCFSRIKVAMPLRRVILFTCRDDPQGLDENDRHSIRERAATFNENGIQLFVYGLKKDWNHDIFYKDLEMLSGNISKVDYERISDNDLLQQIRFPSRVIAKVLWKIGKDIKINVQIFNVCGKSKNLKKMNLCGETNEPLVPYTYYRIAHTYTNKDEENDEEEPIMETEIKHIQKLGGEAICFTSKEVKQLRNICDIGMDMICVKPLKYDPMYHVRAPYFVRFNKNCSKDERLLFGAILSQCDEKDLMIVSSLTIRKTLPTHLYNMIPSLKEGGFYLHKIPYANEVRSLEKRLSEYTYNNNDKKAPIDDRMVALFERVLKKSRMRYSPDCFPNLRLHRQMQCVESLALKLETPTTLEDNTVVIRNTLRSRIKKYVTQIEELNEEIAPKNEELPAQKRKKKETCSESIEELVKRRKVETCTVSTLCNFLKEAGIKTTGRKAELVKRIYEYYSDLSYKNK